jgi:hypothetical protein
VIVALHVYVDSLDFGGGGWSPRVCLATLAIFRTLILTKEALYELEVPLEPTIFIGGLHCHSHPDLLSSSETSTIHLDNFDHTHQEKAAPPVLDFQKGTLVPRCTIYCIRSLVFSPLEFWRFHGRRCWRSQN